MKRAEALEREDEREPERKVAGEAETGKVRGSEGERGVTGEREKDERSLNCITYLKANC